MAEKKLDPVEFLDTSIVVYEKSVTQIAKAVAALPDPPARLVELLQEEPYTLNRLRELKRELERKRAEGNGGQADKSRPLG